MTTSLTATSNHQFFNQGYFDHDDPVESTGSLLLQFSYSGIFEIEEKDKISAVCDELYKHVIQNLEGGKIGNIKYKLVSYQDFGQQRREEARKYIVITRETNRNTRITIVTRFLPYGSKLYVGIDSYVLGALNLRGLVIPSVVTLLPLGCVGITAFSSLASGELSAVFTNLFCSLFCLIPWFILTIPFFWIGPIRSWRQEKDILLALRQNYNYIPKNQSFNIDDALMTLKSVLPLVLNSVSDVLEKFGIPVETLDAFIRNIEVVNNIQNMQNVYGSYNAVSGTGTATVNTTEPSQPSA